MFRSNTIIAGFEWVSREKFKSDTISSSGGGLEVMRKSLISRASGRPKVLNQEKITIAQSLYDDGKTSLEKICSTLGISRATFYRHVTQKAA